MKYRANVCVVVHHPEADTVLVCRRADAVLGAEQWQFPQGGIQAGETPRAALFRELEEEIGTREVTLLARAPRPVRYEYPPRVLSQLAARNPDKPRYLGQEQTWFLTRLAVSEQAICFEQEPREFDAYQWVTPQGALRRVVPFKAAAYRQGLTALGLLPGPA